MSIQVEVKRKYDAVIVGGRVAGAGTAIILARAGMRVLIVERGTPGSDTLSTHALMRGGVMQLHRWGVLDRIIHAGTPPIRKTTFHYGTESIPLEIQERDGIDALYAPRRTVLDAVLVDAACEAGAEIVYRATVTSVVRDASGRVRGVNIVDSGGDSHLVTAGIVIGADGVRSTVARAVEPKLLHEGRTSAAVIYGYWRGLNLDGTHWEYGRDATLGVIPTNDGMACVFVGMRPERYQANAARVDELFTEVIREVDPELGIAVSLVEREGRFFPFPGRPGFIRQSWGRGWALVGDAACFKDPLTAHGITDALRDAELLAKAIIAGSESALEEYQLERDVFAVDLLELSDEIASFDWDFDRLKMLHRRLSKLMNLECEWVRSFAEAPQEVALV